MQLPPDPRRYWILRDDEYHGWNQRLWTLERISRCEWREAYSIFHRTPLFNLEWDIHEVLEALEQTRFFEPPPQYPRLQYFPPAYLGLEQFSAALEALQSAYELLQEAGL